MKKILLLPFVLIASAAIYISCQKEVSTKSSETAAKKSANTIVSEIFPAQDCNADCISEEGESTPTSTTANYNVNFYATVNISNTATDVIFTFISNKDIHYINIDGTVVYCSDDNDGDPIDQNTFSYSVPIGDFGEDWNACDVKTYDISIYRNNCNGNGAGNAVNFEASHTLIGVCPPCTSYNYETAYGGETAGGGNSWWFAFDVSDGSQTIWAGQNINAGTISYAAGVFTINLSNGWELDPAQTESVKISSVSSASGNRPTPGQADVYKGNNLVIDVSGTPSPFYAVHLDVRHCAN